MKEVTTLMAAEPQKPSSLSEATAYFQELNAPQEAPAFFDHFTSNGWRVGGKSPMKDWKAAARNWLRSPYRNASRNKTIRGKEEIITTVNEISRQMEAVW